MNYKLILTYNKDDGNFDKVYVVDQSTGEVVEEHNYNGKVDQYEIYKFLKNIGVKGATGEELLRNAKEDGVFECIDKDDHEKLDAELYTSPVADPVDPIYDEEDELAEDEHYKTSAKRRAVVTGLGGLAAIAAITAGANAVNKKVVSEQNNNNNNNNDLLNEAEDLINSLNEDGKKFFNDVLTSIQNINNQMTKANNFKLDTDKVDLQFSAEDLIAAKIAFNNYTPEQLYNIFGDLTQIGTLKLDANGIYKAMDRVYLKLAAYGMNAVEPSGISSLIEDEQAREFFEKHENVVLAFNANPSIETSDAVLKTLYYDYTYEGMTGSYDEINNDSVARMATAFHFGNQLATRNVPDYNTVHNVSADEKAQYGNGAIVAGTQRAKLLEGNAVLNDVLQDPTFTLVGELNDKSLCASSFGEIEENMDQFNMYKQIMGAINTADKEENKDKIAELEERKETVNNITSLLNQGMNILDHDDVIALMNNRFLPIPEVEKNEDYNISKDEYEKLPEKEKDDYVKEHGTVVEEHTDVVEEQVDKEDLTPSEKEDVEWQENLLRKVDALSAELQKQGIYDANDYVEKEGAYKYGKTIVNPFNNEVVDTTKLSLFNIVAHAEAFGDGANEINHNDKQIQDYLNSIVGQRDDVVIKFIDSLSDKEKSYVASNYGDLYKQLMDTYRKTFGDEVDNELKTARTFGDQLRSDAEKAYNEAVKNLPPTEVVDEGKNDNDDDNKDENKDNETPNTPPSQSEDPELSDYPNGEEPWVPPIIDEPVDYVDNISLEDAFNALYGNYGPLSQETPIQKTK